MKKLLTVYLLLLAGLAQGQDLFQGSLFPAEMVMKNRESISLTDQQAEKIKAIHSKNAGEFSTLRWDLDAENEKLKKLLQEPKINSEAAQKQMDKVLNLENQLKKRQFSNLLAIRNELNAEQASELAKFNKPNISVMGYKGNGRIEGISTKNSVSAFSVTPTYSATDGEKKSTSIVLRGTSNLSGENQPLYIIKKDGKEKIIKDKDMNDMDPNDIESITVLKDATATVQYGPKGSNGVIIITLKKGVDFKFEK